MQPRNPTHPPLRRPAIASALASLGLAGLLAGPARSAPMEIGSPQYSYRFGTSFPDGFEALGPVFYQTGGALSVGEDLGLFPDGNIDREVFANFGALPFSVMAKTLATLPNPGTQDPIGTHAVLGIAQSFRKDEADASLSFTITRMRFIGLDPSPAGDDAEVFLALRALVEAYVQPGNNFFEFFRAPTLFGLGRANPGPGLCNPPCWSLEADGLPLAVSVGGLDQGYVEIDLAAPFTQAVDLSAVPVGEEFTVLYTSTAFARDTAQVDSGGSASFKDPLDPDSGTYFEFTGLTPTDNPIVVPEPGRTALLLAGGAVLLGLRGASRRSRPGPPERSPGPPGLARELAAIRAFPVSHR